MAPLRPQLKLIRSMWGVVVQEPSTLDPLLLSTATSTSTSPAPPVQSKSIPSTLDHKLFPSRQVFFQHLKANGFAGVEASLADMGATQAERQAYARALADAGLDLVCGVYSSWQDYEGPAARDHYKPVSEHLAQLEEQLREAIDLGPVHVNAHSGCDAWEEGGDALRFFEGALALQARALPTTGPRVSHETHRGRPLGHPFVAGRLLQRLPELRITADVSHWFVACERLLHTPAPDTHNSPTLSSEAQLMLLAAARTDHVHARVGSSQSPQVANPLDRKRFGAEAAAHMAFWREVLRAQERQGRAASTFTPEYGPAPYSFDPQADVDALIMRAGQALREQLSSDV